MRSKTQIFGVIATLAVVTTLSGCRYAGMGKVTSWRPGAMWSGGNDLAEAGDEELVARSAPALPSSQFTPGGEAAGGTPPAFAATTPAATPTGPGAAPYSPVAQTEYTSPATSPTMPVTPPTGYGAVAANPTGMAPQTSPYATTPIANPSPSMGMAATSPPASPADSSNFHLPGQPMPPQGAIDPLASLNQTMQSVAGAAQNRVQGAANTVGSTANNMATGVNNAIGSAVNQFNLPSLPTPGGMPNPSDPSALVSGVPTAGPSAAPSASVALPSVPGGYRPGGTSNYNAGGATSVATRPAVPTGTEPAGAYPSTLPNPAPSSFR